LVTNLWFFYPVQATALGSFVLGLCSCFQFSDQRPKLQFSGEGLVQQRLLQRLQRGVLPLGEAGEALGGGSPERA
jgi:hypothetical protein